jgi:hypothetical protein
MKCNEFTIDNCIWYPAIRILVASSRGPVTPAKSIVIGKTRTVEFTELHSVDHHSLRARIAALYDNHRGCSWWFYNKELNIVLVVFREPNAQSQTFRKLLLNSFY